MQETVLGVDLIHSSKKYQTTGIAKFANNQSKRYKLMTSPYEYGREKEKKQQAKRFRELSENSIDSMLSSIERVIDEGSYNVSVMKDLERVRHWLKKTRHGHTIKS